MMLRALLLVALSTVPACFYSTVNNQVWACNDAIAPVADGERYTVCVLTNIRGSFQ
jgi:hypothetical protein